MLSKGFTPNQLVLSANHVGVLANIVNREKVEGSKLTVKMLKDDVGHAKPSMKSIC
jgi:hypothetical protein